MQGIIKLLNDKKIKFALILLAIIILGILLFSTISNGKKKRVCNDLRQDIITSMDKYVNDNNLLPNLNGTSITVEIDKLDDKFTLKDSIINGTVTYTKYNDEYIKTVEIKNANYCTTNKFGRETDKYNSKNNVKVNVYFNYYTVESYNSKWSNYMPSEQISSEQTNGIELPLDIKKLPVIPSNAIVTEYVKEDKTYYSYRDKKWNWYKNDIVYSDYSSTKPAGFTTKDKDTLKYTEQSEWSLNYPEEYEYRHIKSQTGYQWYYKDGKETIYWENGKYSIESPGSEYKKDTKKSAKMYSYYDETWRWYNGDTRRVYSSLNSTKPNGYNYKDASTLTYTKWSNFKDTSSINEKNISYREERTDIYSRYLIKYDVYSYAIFDKPVTLDELEEKIGKSYEEIVNDKTIKLDIIFKFQNEA